MTNVADTTNFFKRVDVNEEYWTNYLSTRPDYGPSFYDLVYNFHQAHHGGFELAHDIATGPGQVAAELAKHFGSVVASDNNITHLAIARQRLGSLVTEQHHDTGVHLFQCQAESIGEKESANSTDLVVAAECMPLLDVHTAVMNFHSILKPGGTLAIWFYGRPHFAEPEYARNCQPIFSSIVDTLFSQVIKGGGPRHITAWKRSTETMMSFLDNIDLSSTGHWIDVTRIKWNSEYQLSFNGVCTCDFDVTVTSKIDYDREKVTEVQDASLWEREWDLKGVKTFISGLFPTFDEVSSRSKDLEGMYQELAQAMGGKHAVRKFTWPAVLLLASKK